MKETNNPMFSRPHSPNMFGLISGLILAGLIGGSLLEGLMVKVAPDSEPYLPHEPYPYTNLPIASEFNEGKLEPLKLLAAFDFSGSGSVSFENSYLKYKSSTWSWLVIRTKLQDVVSAKWVWKAVEGREFVIEAWEAYGDFGRTAMIIFRDGKVYQVQYPKEIYLMDFNPFSDFIIVQMTVDYNASEIEDLWINEHHFSHLPINDEGLGRTVSSPFWQMQIFLRKSATVLVKEMEAWK
jgi:hypothetical protein